MRSLEASNFLELLLRERVIRFADRNIVQPNLNAESPLPKNVAQHQPELASFPSGSNG